MSPSFKRVVETGYDRMAESYLATKNPEDPATLAALEDLAYELPPGAAVLDLGCGAGVPVARRLAAQGFALTGVAISSRQLALARRHVPAAEFIRADMTTLTFGAGAFDAVVAFYSIIHVPRVEHAALLAKVYSWLKSGGVFLATLSVGAWEGEESDREGWSSTMRVVGTQHVASLLPRDQREHVERGGVRDPLRRGADRNGPRRRRRDVVVGPRQQAAKTMRCVEDADRTVAWEGEKWYAATRAGRDATNRREMPTTITGAVALDVRFPTSRDLSGSDAMNEAPDYSAAYVILKTDSSLEGHGLTFTIGRGNELCVAAIESLAPLVVGRTLESFTQDMGAFWRHVTGDSQLRWLGPEKGVIHLATAAIVNAVWDLWAKAENKPVWKLLADMSPEEVVRCVDFRYITDALTPEEALEILRRNEPTKGEREEEMLRDGFPAYTTSAGWLGYPDEKVRRLSREAVAEGWNHVKIKVGRDVEDDARRAAIIREEIGPDRKLMMDANQVWDVDEAIENMGRLEEFDPWWIEEPTSPDDVLGHARIARAVAPIGVATGEHCQNRVVFKQLLQAGAIRFCQIDSCRLGGVNEIIAVLLMAAKFGVPVCPHAGGVGLCEYVQHLSIFDYIQVGASLEDRVLEYVDHLHEHFLDPVRIKNGRYAPPERPGYSIEMYPESLEEYAFPAGKAWAAERSAT